ncbi:hypothetical protein EOT10_30165 [Streptomyces antnestii]|uniref:Uncharacterized protein n=1 Tax=Streptomyces antnestii TaxID=2494256 RepID=A0A3S2VC21_9ACTN|nr:hypothetical protein [Streptomyces sp. San01]RVU19255.1 hypothetical protein EOT10_30165 [Streptomyces sp. San01]
MSYNQPGPYGGQQPQQPGPYGQPQQPGPYGQQPPAAPQPGYGYPQQPPQGVPPQQPGPYGQPGGYSQPQQPGPYGQQPQAPYGQAPYGQVPPPPGAPGGGKKKTGLIIGAVAVVAAIGVGAYLIFSGGGASVADDGPHKLITPATVMGDYKRMGEDKGAQDATSGDAKVLAQSGVTNAKAVSAIYSTISLTPGAAPSAADIATSKAVSFMGIYGKVKDPEAAIDSTFAGMKKEQAKKSEPTMTFVGDPQTVEPDGLDGAVMKCQQAQAKNAATQKVDTQYMCLWADYSTIGMGVPAAGGKGTSLDDSAKVTADLRKEVRVAE